jgi:Tol biopolymer transport system component
VLRLVLLLFGENSIIILTKEGTFMYKRTLTVTLLTVFYGAAVVLVAATIPVEKQTAFADKTPARAVAVDSGPASKTLANATAYIPPQCYTKTVDTGTIDSDKTIHNTCYTCHTRGVRPEFTYDQGLQTEYAFPRDALTNPWHNLFKKRDQQVAGISDQKILDYVRESNYFDPDGQITLARTLGSVPEAWDRNGDNRWSGFIPDCYFDFDSQGFDRDRSGRYTGWRAMAYYPLPSTHWPTNSGFGDVLIRLPEPFRTFNQKYDMAVYKLNLAILEALFKRTAVAIDPTDERRYGVDLDQNGTLDKAEVVAFGWAPKEKKKMFYVGDALDLQQQGRVHLSAGLFPVGTEFMNTLRYTDIADGIPGDQVRMSRRFKELRYLKKRKWLTYAQLHLMGLEEDKEKHDFPDRPKVPFGDMEHGLSNDKGWIAQGFIEDSGGRLRPQTVNETMTCIGCHGGMGVTTDSIVSFVRKLDASAHQRGWFHWTQKDLKGVNEPKVAFEKAGTQYEYCYYLMYSLAGDEFRANGEVMAKFFDTKGYLRPDMAEKIHQDLSFLLYPSEKRALTLNKIYKTIVEEQSYLEGKTPIDGVAANIFRQIHPEDRDTGISNPIILTRRPRAVVKYDQTSRDRTVEAALKTAVDGSSMPGPAGRLYAVDENGLINESTYAVKQKGFYFPFPTRHTLPTRTIVPNADNPVCYSCHRLPSVMDPADLKIGTPVPLPLNSSADRLVQLTHNSGTDTNAIFSPDGRTIAWTSDRREGFQIWTMGRDGSNKRQITHGPAIHGWPQWSPDGTKLLYWGFDRDTGESTLSTCRVDGTKVVDLLTSPDRLDRPVWHPAGKYIAYAAQDARDNWDIWVAAADGSAFYRMTRDAQMETNPLWSPDGQAIAYKVAPNGTYNLTVENFMDLAKGIDTPEYRLWDGIKSIQMNDWSPDGRFIAYTAEAVTGASGEDRVSYLAMVEDVSLTGSKTSGTPVMLSEGFTLGDRGPRFSPDGTRVVFWAWDQAYRATLWLARVDGSKTQRLTSVGFDMYPSWHPDGQTILFESGRGGNLNIWTMAVDKS